jgi:hypothetical protein
MVCNHCVDTLTLLVGHPAAEVLLQVSVLVVVDAHKGVARLCSQVANQAGLATAGGALGVVVGEWVGGWVGWGGGGGDSTGWLSGFNENKRCDG